MKKPVVLLLTPPFVQTNCPYPATMHLTGYLKGLGIEVYQRDLSIKVVSDVLRQFGDETTDELIEILQNPRIPPEAKLDGSGIIESLAVSIRDEIDAGFGFSRYAERICSSAASFSEVQRLVKRRGVMDGHLERHLDEAMRETSPDLVGVTCPFPGTLIGAFKIARTIKKKYPGVKTVLGGGFVSTEMRETDDRRIRKYFDEVILDEGYLELAELLGIKNAKVPFFVKPDYDGIDLGEYFDVVETENPMHTMWSSGKWIKLVMARGCYWRRCAFCDVHLPYIGRFQMPEAGMVVDAMEELGELQLKQGECPSFHFVDEAMPPALIEAVSKEIVRRRLKCRWWGNIRFDKAFTPKLARLMAKAGCVAVTGGLECADDRLLKLMNKGITLEGARAAMVAFRDAGVMVHAYLMYAFPTQTEAEAMRALDFVRLLFRDGLIASAFYHRFALTVHSPIAANPSQFGIEIRRPKSRAGRIFRRNEIDYFEPGAPDWDRIGRILTLALYNFMQGRGLSKTSKSWWKTVQAGL